MQNIRRSGIYSLVLFIIFLMFSISLNARESDSVQTKVSGKTRAPEEFPENFSEAPPRKPAQENFKKKLPTPKGVAPLIEWFAFRLGAGEYMISIELLAPTLRWKYAYLTTVSIGSNPSTLFLPYKDIFFYLGPTVGFPLYLESAMQHELRFGVGPHWGGTYNDSRTVARSCELEPQHFSGTLGTFLSIELLYQYRLKSHLSFSAGIRSLILIPALSMDATCYPHIPLFFFLGMAF